MSTNAIRLIESAGIEFSTCAFPVSDEHIDAIEVARLLDVEAERVFKTLVCENTDGGHCVCVIPGPSELDLKKAAKAAGVKRIRMLPLGQLTEITGYVRGGCSPIGMKRQLPTFLEESAMLFDTIFVSAGERGLQIAIAPESLVSLTQATYADLV